MTAGELGDLGILVGIALALVGGAIALVAALWARLRAAAARRRGRIVIPGRRRWFGDADPRDWQGQFHRGRAVDGPAPRALEREERRLAAWPDRW